MEINNLYWKVRYTSVLDENLFGRTDYDTLTIFISNNTCSQTQDATLIHELVHAYMHSYGFMFKDNFTREDVCEFIAHNLFTLLDLFDKAKKELQENK